MQTSQSAKKLDQIKLSQHVLYILIFSLVTIVIWIIFSLFKSQTTSEIDPELIELSQQLNPNIKVEIIEEISNRKDFSASELSQFPIYVITGERGQQRVVTLTEFNELIEEERAVEAAKQAEQDQAELDSQPAATPEASPLGIGPLPAVLPSN